MRTLADVVKTIEDGEFYLDYDQSVSDLAILRNAVKSLEVLSIPEANRFDDFTFEDAGEPVKWKDIRRAFEKRLRGNYEN